MRRVGDVLGKKRADRFIQFLAAHSIEAEARDDGEDRFGLWIINEDDLLAAEEHFRAYKVAPDAPTFDVKAPPEGVAKKSAGISRSWGGMRERSRYIDVRTEIFARGGAQRMPVTVALIALSVLATLISGIPRLSDAVRALYFSEYFGQDFPEILHGQVWRLVTPIFLHGGIWHLLFNMMWLYQFGGAIEIEESSVYLGFMTLGFAVVVDTAQYLVSGPVFIGMSGVVYALLGYIWMMSRYQAGTRYALAMNTVVIMVGWMVVCLTGLIPHVANTQHVVGFIVGVVWGLIRSGYIWTLLRQRRYRRR